MTERLNVVGANVPRHDALAKVTGRARYVADLPCDGAWVGGALWSRTPRARVRNIVFAPDFDWSRVTVITARDVPGPNEVHMIKDDYPILAGDEISYIGQALALVAAPDKKTLEEALAAMRPDLEELPPVLSVEASLAKEEVIWGEDNIQAHYRIDHGDLDEAFSRSDAIIEETYRTHHQEHLYLETNGMFARPRSDGGVIVEGSLQCPYYVARALAHALGLPLEKVTLRQTETGGAFGGKEDYPSVLAIQTALLALKSGKPVRMVLERREDIDVTTKRHPSVIRHRTGVTRDGVILAAEIDIIFDGGAFSTMSPVVLSRGVLHAWSAYRLPNARIVGRALATNTAPNGAFRGFGAPQTVFAMERQMDRIARELGLSPLEVRRKNLLKAGDTLPCGQVLRSAYADLVLERALAISGYEEKHGKRHDDDRILRGVGVSVFLHGGGFTGAGEEKISGRAAVEVADDGIVEVLVSSTEMGQGAATVLPQIAAEVLALPAWKVRHPNPDTSRVPDSGPTVASRTTMMVGKILQDAAKDMRATLTAEAAKIAGVLPESIFWENGRLSSGGNDLGSFEELAVRYKERYGKPLRGEGVYTPPSDCQWNEAEYRGDAYKDYAWACDVVEVEIDADTLELRVPHVTSVVEIGKAVHPMLAEGQVIGGTLQALGWGAMEDVKMEKGRYRNNSVSTYIIPTAVDAPDFTVEIAETPSPYGPWGAKGLGELPMDGGAPALASAVEDALGVFATELPLTSDRLHALLRQRRK